VPKRECFIEIYGKCRIYDCEEEAEALVIFQRSDGKIYHFLECFKHAEQWRKISGVVIISLKGGA